MANNRRLMSEALREELARDLGVYELAARYGWGAVPARECGRLVQQAVRRAEELLARQYGGAPAAAAAPPGPPLGTGVAPWGYGTANGAAARGSPARAGPAGMAGSPFPAGARVRGTVPPMAAMQPPAPPGAAPGRVSSPSGGPAAPG